MLSRTMNHMKNVAFGFKSILTSKNNSLTLKCYTTMSNHVMLKPYLKLPIPQNKILATYVWIDGSGIYMRSKDKVVDCLPCSVDSLANWSFDGSSTGQATTSNSEVTLVPCALYNDPFHDGDHVLVLCETYNSDGEPTHTNFRANCAKLMNTHAKEEPWFGIEQEYTMLDSDNWPLGWPKHGYPATVNKYSYCGVGVGHVVGRCVVEAHQRACLYAGVDYEGSNAEVMKSSWEFQVGTSKGIKGADDIWMSRYILSRIGEDFGVQITYHPKPMGDNQPGIGCHHNFSTSSMRTDGGIKVIEEACKRLGKNHKQHMDGYGLGDGLTNRLRLTGNFETASHEKFSWGVADRGASIRIQRSVATKGKGFLEDRRPAGDCDPYRVCGLLLETCLGAAK